MRRPGRCLQETEVAEVGDEPCADRLEALRKRPNELTLQHVACQPAEDEHARQRHDECGDLAVGDEYSPAAMSRPELDDSNDLQLPGPVDVHLHPGNMKTDHQNRRAAADESDDEPTDRSMLPPTITSSIPSAMMTM